MPAEPADAERPSAGPALQLKVRLLEVSPMVWRRLLVPVGASLRELHGIGPIHALTILAEAGDLRRFGHHRQFLKFCGLDLAHPPVRRYRGQTRLSKFGNARLRRAPWLAANVAIRQKGNSFRDKFERYTAKDRRDADLRRKV